MEENKLTLEYINETEEAWEVVLPQVYKEFLLEHSGDVPEKRNFSNKDKIYVVDRFLGIFPDFETNSLGMYDIDVVISELDCRLLEKRDVCGYELIPIATLYAGDFLCLDFRKSNDSPSVCIWNHEESEEYNPYTEFVCDDFNDFLGLLYR